jgi:hypothetical protein
MPSQNDQQKLQSKQDQRTILNNLYKEYELTKADVFSHRHYVLITRSGMEKIQAKSGILSKMELVSGGPQHAIIKGVFANPNTQEEAETFASANPDNSTSAYYAEMAEKRCLSRGILKLLGLYALGFFGDDEFDTKTMSESEATAYKNSRRSIYQSDEKKRAVFKG